MTHNRIDNRIDNRIRKGFLTPLFISVLVLSLCSIGLGIASAQTAVSIEPLTKTVDQGETFNLNISVDPAAVAIAGVQCDLSFNSSLVTVNSITEGNLLGQGGADTYFASGTIDNVAGTVTGIVGAITTPGETVSTKEAFAIVSLTANGVDGTTGIDLSNVIVGIITGDPVDIGISNGTVIVGAAPVLTISEILFNSAASPTVTAGEDVNVSVTVSNSDGWENISTVLVDMSAFGAGSAEELSLMANDTTWAIFNKSIQVTKATAATATANASDKAGNWSGDFTSGTLTVNPADAYQLKIFGLDSSVPAEHTLYQQVAIQDQYGNNLTTVNTFSHWVTMSKTAGHAVIKEPNPQWINDTNTTAEGVFDTTFEIKDGKDEETTIKVTSTGLLPDTKTLTYYGSIDHLDVSLDKTSMNANGGTDTILVTVQLKDADGADIKSAGESVEISQNTGAGLFGGLTSDTTDANGKTTFVITSTMKSGSDEVYAIATPSGATGTSGTITVTAIVNPANSAMTPADTTVMAGTEVSVSVTTKDYDNKVISGVTVSFNVTNGKGKLDGTAAGTPVTAVSDASGLAKVTFVCNTAGDASTINATIGGVVVGTGNNPVITIVPNVINQFAVNPGKGIGLKNVPGTLQPIAIQLKDVHGNNNMTADVQILVTTDNTVLGNMTNGTTYYNNDLYLTTDGSGIATFTYQVNDSEAGTANLAINATAYGVTDTIAIVTSGPEGIYLSFNESIPMVGESVLATAQLTNAAGNPLTIIDKNITFTVRNPSGTLVGTSETPTGLDGAATFVITPAMVNGMPGVYTVTAKNDPYGLEDVNTATFVGHAVELVLEANQTGSIVSLTATMKDANDLTTSDLDGEEVTFNANGMQIAKVVLNNGVASTTHTQSTSATVTIVAFRNVTLQDSVTVEFNNGYKGKTYTGGSNITTVKSYDLNGNLVYSVGDSHYLSGSGSTSHWTAYDVAWTASDLPVTGTVREARLYVTYTWDKDGVMPGDVSMSFNGVAQTQDAQYSDRKGYDGYDYPYGMLAYNVTDDFAAGSNVANLTNSHVGGGNVSMRGMLLVAIYADASEPRRLIYVNEEFDLLYGGSSKYTTPEEATAWAPITGSIDTTTVANATLITVAPGADGPEGELIFNGQVWTDVWNYAGNSQIGIDERDVALYLESTDNLVGFQSSEDYMEASNAFLVVTVDEAEYDSADTNHDCVVSMPELMTQIGKWRSAEIGMPEMMTSIGRWKLGDGGYC